MHKSVITSASAFAQYAVLYTLEYSCKYENGIFINLLGGKTKITLLKFCDFDFLTRMFTVYIDFFLFLF